MIDIARWLGANDASHQSGGFEGGGVTAVEGGKDRSRDVEAMPLAKVFKVSAKRPGSW